MSWLRPIDVWFADAVLPYEADLLRQARRWVTGDEDARDLVHEAYTQLLQLAGWEAIANPAAYAVRIVRNLALQRLRRAQIVPIRQLAALEEVEWPDPSPDSFATVAAQDELRRVMAAVEALPGACRRVVLMRKFDELSPRVIADRLGLSLSTVEKHLARGMVLLARSLRDAPIGSSVRHPPAVPAVRREG